MPGARTRPETALQYTKQPPAHGCDALEVGTVICNYIIGTDYILVQYICTYKIGTKLGPRLHGTEGACKHNRLNVCLRHHYLSAAGSHNQDDATSLQPSDLHPILPLTLSSS